MANSGKYDMSPELVTRMTRLFDFLTPEGARTFYVVRPQRAACYSGGTLKVATVSAVHGHQVLNAFHAGRDTTIVPENVSK